LLDLLYHSFNLLLYFCLTCCFAPLVQPIAPLFDLLLRSCSTCSAPLVQPIAPLLMICCFTFA
jgi:hypothetical protein